MDSSTVTAITTKAASQHGLISTDQLSELEVTPAQVRVLRQRGVLEVEAPRVFAVAGAPRSPHRSLRAGLLCLGASALVSHEAAGWLHAFDRCIPDAVEFSMPRHGRGRATPFRVHTSASLRLVDRVTVAGYACTSATRTIIDLARARIPTIRLEAAIDSAVRSGASAPLVIVRRLAEIRGPGRWGAPLLDDLLLDSGGHTLSERRFLSLVRAYGLTRPSMQVVHRRDGRTFARVDFSWPELGVVVEVSGRRGHASDAERARDAHRRNELQDVGVKVYEYTWADVTRHPDDVSASLRARLASAAASVRESG